MAAIVAYGHYDSSAIAMALNRFPIQNRPVSN
jgi:hypothetical protein